MFFLSFPPSDMKLFATSAAKIINKTIVIPDNNRKRHSLKIKHRRSTTSPRYRPTSAQLAALVVPTRFQGGSVRPTPELLQRSLGLLVGTLFGVTAGELGLMVRVRLAAGWG